MSRFNCGSIVHSRTVVLLQFARFATSAKMFWEITLLNKCVKKIMFNRIPFNVILSKNTTHCFVCVETTVFEFDEENIEKKTPIIK